VKRITWALAASVLVAVVGPAFAGETVSQSNDPGILLGSQLASLLDREKTAISAVGGGVVRRLNSTGAADAEPVLDEKWLAGLAAPTGSAEEVCLAQAIYFEARSESLEGQVAVAEVVMNRRDSGIYPGTVCGVVHQGAGRMNECQFSYNCDGMAEVIAEPLAYDRAGRIAQWMLDGAPREITAGATHYHNDAVNPGWARQFEETAQIGTHTFYRIPG
jgi:hypothetical protein